MIQELIESIRRAAAEIGQEAGRLAERIGAELKLAEGMISLHAGKEKAWRRIIDKAAGVVLSALAGGREDRDVPHFPPRKMGYVPIFPCSALSCDRQVCS